MLKVGGGGDHKRPATDSIKHYYCSVDVTCGMLIGKDTVLAAPMGVPYTLMSQLLQKEHNRPQSGGPASSLTVISPPPRIRHPGDSNTIPPPLPFCMRPIMHTNVSHSLCSPWSLGCKRRSAVRRIEWSRPVGLRERPWEVPGTP